MINLYHNFLKKEFVFYETIREKMAERRMFSKRIVNSARFLQMPASTQALYFHLALNADDDGVVEAFMIMRQTGASEDELKLLNAKKFITVLNEEMVTYINNWLENNSIRPDRKVDSIHQKLLLQIIPDVEIVEKKERSDVAKKSKSRKAKTIDTKGVELVDGPRTTNGRLRVGKDRVGEVSIGKGSDDDKTPVVTVDEILNTDTEISEIEKPKQDDRTIAYSALVSIFENNNFGTVSGFNATDIMEELDNFADKNNGDYKEAFKVIQLAAKISSQMGKCNFKYTWGITQSWYVKKMYTLADIEAAEKKREDDKIKGGQKYNGGYNKPQRVEPTMNYDAGEQDDAENDIEKVKQSLEWLKNSGIKTK